MSDAAEAELGEVDDSVRAELLIRAAEYRGDREGFGVGVELIDRALELYAELPATAGHVRALNYKRLLLIGLGQLEDAEVLARTAVETASAVGDPRLHRHQIASVAWIEGIEGRLTTMSELFELGRSLLPPGTDPVGDIRAAMMACDALVYNGSHLQDVEDAARPGFEAAQAWAIDNESYEILCASLATARLRAGRTEDAEALIGASSEQPPDPDRWHHHQLRAAADVHRGRLDAAAERIGFIVREVMVDDEIDLETLCVAADVEFWRGGMQPTLPRLLRDLDRCVDSSPVRAVLPTILAGSRGVAEEVLAHRPGSSTARALAGDLLSRAGARMRPGDAEDSHVRAHLATASAELARAGREDRATAWTELIPLWDTLGRPHDAAYCRWRASEVALAAGRRTAAQKLLRAAARDARSHLPLASAIATTAAYAPQT
jgi:hypothetical protein